MTDLTDDRKITRNQKRKHDEINHVQKVCFCVYSFRANAFYVCTMCSVFYVCTEKGKQMTEYSRQMKWLSTEYRRLMN